MRQRPLSPFMIGPYYRPQLTSVLSITHRATGVLLSVAGVPILLWWIVALNQGEPAYAAMLNSLAGIPGRLLAAACVFSLCFHFFNGIRHLIWDTGRWLEIDMAYRTGWLVVAASVASTALILWVFA